MGNIDPVIREIDDEIGSLLGTLPRVEAPKDFDFGVRARIARHGHRSTSQGSWGIFVKAGVPAVLVLTVGGYFFINSHTPSAGPVPAVAVVQPAVGEPKVDYPQAAPPTVVPRTADPEIASISEPKVQAMTSEQHVRAAIDKKQTGKLTAANGGGSFVQTLGSARSMDSNTGQRSTSLPASGRILAVAALSSFGIHAALSGGSYTVTSVTPGSASERAGLRNGDVIEAINGAPASASTTFEKVGDVHSLRVSRDGKPVDITLR